MQTFPASLLLTLQVWKYEGRSPDLLVVRDKVKELFRYPRPLERILKWSEQERKWKTWSARLSSSQQTLKINGGHTISPLHQSGGEGDKRGALRGRGPADQPGERAICVSYKQRRRRSRRRGEERGNKWTDQRGEQTDLLVSFLFPRLDWERLHLALELVHLHVQRVYRVLEERREEKLLTEWTKRATWRLRHFVTDNIFIDNETNCQVQASL